MSIDPNFLWLVLAIAVVAVVLGASLNSKPEKSARKKAKDEDVSRWRVFQIHPAPLHTVRKRPQVVVSEQPKGARLQARPSYANGWEIFADDKETDSDAPLSRAEIYERGFLRPWHHARLNGREWLSIRAIRRKPKQEGRALPAPQRTDFLALRATAVTRLRSSPRPPSGCDRQPNDECRREQPRPLST